MEKVCLWCGRPLYRGWLKNRTEQIHESFASVHHSTIYMPDALPDAQPTVSTY